MCGIFNAQMREVKRTEELHTKTMHFITILLVSSFYIAGVYASPLDGWKDEWIRNWEHRALQRHEQQQDASCPPDVVNSTNCVNILPRYVPARVKGNYTQLIPTVIWQTWKSVHASGPNHFAAVMSFIDHNPEYDYYMFDDDDALEFMCTFFPEHSLIYQQVVPGAAKADLWRLAIITKYGGVYFDTDSESTTPLREIIWANASVVTGLGSLGDFHQWALLYTPNHEIIRTTLQIAARRLRHLHANRQGGSIVTATGPGALSAGVDRTLQSFNCTSLSRLRQQRKSSREIIDVHQTATCSDGVGILQIYTQDFLGHQVLFKHPRADAEKNRVSVYYGAVQHRFEGLFREVRVLDTSPTTVTVGQCELQKVPKYKALLARGQRAVHTNKKVG